jgi:hypothetical protein
MKQSQDKDMDVTALPFTFTVPVLARLVPLTHSIAPCAIGLVETDTIVGVDCAFK